MKKYFSNKKSSFYTADCIDIYTAQGVLPDDLAELTENDYQNYIGAAPEGKIPYYDDEKSAMKWIDAPPLSDSEALANAGAMRRRLMQAATTIIDPLRDAVELGRASESEKALLLSWQMYRIDLMQLDISDPAAIVWPVVPDVA